MSDTRPDLEAITARAAAATGMPWVADLTVGPDDLTTYRVIDSLGDFDTISGVIEEDAEFIAHAREDVPALLSALAAERDRADRAEARISLIRHRYNNWDGKESALFPLLNAIDIAIAPKEEEATA